MVTKDGDPGSVVLGMGIACVLRFPAICGETPFLLSEAWEPGQKKRCGEKNDRDAMLHHG